MTRGRQLASRQPHRQARPSRPSLRTALTAELTGAERAAIRGLLWAAFGTSDDEAFTEDDWDHAVGGLHFVLELGGELVAHASVVERELHLAGRPFRTGYVEAVATAGIRQGRGYGTQLMQVVTAHILEQYELGALGTGRHRFYERLGWLRWAGPASVRTTTGMLRTPDDDGFIMVLPTRSSGDVDVSAPISCEWRPGEVW